MRAIVAERGQVTIPKPLRDKLGIVGGSVLSFELREGKIVITKEMAVDTVAKVFGCLRGATPYTATDDYMTEIRGPAESE